jgi:hypothetical protein
MLIVLLLGYVSCIEGQWSATDYAITFTDGQVDTVRNVTYFGTDERGWTTFFHNIDRICRYRDGDIKRIEKIIAGAKP